MHLVVEKRALKDYAVAGTVGAVTVLHIVKELANIPGAVYPLLDAVAGLLVLVPLALVNHTVLVRDICTGSVGTVVLPMAFVKVAIERYKLSEALGPAVDESALVPRAVILAEHAISMALAPQPLASVPDADGDGPLGAVYESIAVWHSSIIFSEDRHLIRASGGFSELVEISDSHVVERPVHGLVAGVPGDATRGLASEPLQQLLQEPWLPVWLRI
jgi:hypothetical protein